MTVFLDNDLSPRMGRALRALGEDVQYLGDEFDRATPDAQWVPEVAARGWPILTADRAMMRRFAELEVLRDCRAIVAFYPPRAQSLRLWEQFVWLVPRWRGILRGLAAASPGDLFEITMRGDLRPVQLPAARRWHS